jgi:hypothetical protein
MTVALMVQQPPMCPGAWSVRHQRLKSNGRASVGCSIQTRRGDAVVAKRRVMYSSAMYTPTSPTANAVRPSTTMATTTTGTHRGKNSAVMILQQAIEGPSQTAHSAGFFRSCPAARTAMPSSAWACEGVGGAAHDCLCRGPWWQTVPRRRFKSG